MKYAVLFAATAALALAACSESETPAPEASASETAAATDTAAALAGPAAFVVGEAPSKEFMVGTWGDGENCELPMTFAADGTIKDGPFAKWDLVDGNLTMEGAPQKMALTVVDDTHLKSQIEGAEPHTLKRCG
jgi:hypothetical protein